MKALIQSWRRLWKRELPFLQVELAPLHEGLGKALNYAVIREKQRDVMDALPGVHNVCILDAGDARNIHVRKKRPVGEGLHLIGKQTESPGALPVRNKRNSRKLSCDGLRLFIL